MEEGVGGLRGWGTVGGSYAPGFGAWDWNINKDPIRLMGYFIVLPAQHAQYKPHMTQVVTQRELEDCH